MSEYTLSLTCPTCGFGYEHTMPDPSFRQKVWYTLKWKLWKAPNCGFNCGFQEINDIQNNG